MGEACKWPASLEKAPGQARGFYLTIGTATLAGIALNFLGIDPIRALFWAAALNGVLAAPVMAVVMHMASSRKVMDKFTIPLYLRVVGWIATAIMVGVSIGVIATQ